MKAINTNAPERKPWDVEQAVAISWDAKGNLILRQQSWHDHESVISISETGVAEFVDRLTDAVGIPSVP